LHSWKKTLDDGAEFIFIVGATATGKTELSLALAQQLNWPIINFDSLQVYQKLDIGTSKPNLAERKQAEHHLFDYISPPQSLTAARYIEDLQKLLKLKKIKKAIFVGGSGFYLQAIRKGLYPQSSPTPEIKSDVLKWLEKVGFAVAHAWIAERDPESAGKISVNDHYRIQRTVEILKTHGVPRSQLQSMMEDQSYSPLPRHRALTIGLDCPRDQLLHRVGDRTSKMLASGWIDEVQELINQGFESWPPLASVGYKEVVDFVKQNNQDIDVLKEQILRSTMRLTKKQKTWFKRDPYAQWFLPNQFDQAIDQVSAWLSTVP
jgi:tRNA dimethylallyltransferase